MPQHRRAIVERLESEGAWLISGLDLEVRWLAEDHHPRFLTPPESAVRCARKPEIAAARKLEVKTPPWIPITEEISAIHAFCRSHDWCVWVKGGAYDSLLARSWKELQQAIDTLKEIWGDPDLFIQAHVKGVEVSIAFAAYQGELLDAQFMEKRMVTPDGKTWAGRVGGSPKALLGRLATLLREVEWTGGGELEFVRDEKEELWLIDWNPRFPAWIHGLTLCGWNLPARLVAAASGFEMTEAAAKGREFIRVITEIPVRESLELSRPVPGEIEPRSGGKHPSGMTQLMRRLKPGSEQRQRFRPLDVDLREELTAAVERRGETPDRVRLDSLRRRSFDRFQKALESLPHRKEILVAYSMKTNPHEVFLKESKARGFHVEAISQDEIRHALANGFQMREVVYNGPLPLQGIEGNELPGYVFVDSVECLEMFLPRAKAFRHLGVRICPPWIQSRFGVRVAEAERFQKLVDLCGRLPEGPKFGISMHLQSSEIGLRRWEAAVESVLEFAAGMERLSGKPISVVDLGGGFTPADFYHAAETILPGLVRRIEEQFPGIEQIIIEPGKALVEETEAILTRVMEVRKYPSGQRHAIVDTSISEAPLLPHLPHRIVAWGDNPVLLPRGDDAILGRLCMENDVITASIGLPEELKTGDLLIICDTGAYDSSMSYTFGRGGGKEPL